MDWDARGMYVHLLCMAWQENPPGSIPNDDAVIRRWLNLSRDIEDDLRVWRRVRPQIMTAWVLRDGRWYQKALCEAFGRNQGKRLAGSNGGLAKGKQNPSRNTGSASDAHIQEGSFLLSSKEKPSLEEVIQYCRDRGNLVDPQKWFDYYSANGWKVGRNPMRDWRAAVRTWEKNGYGEDRRNHQTKQPSVAVSRFHNNLAEVERVFGASAVAAVAGANGSGQASRPGTGHSLLLDGEVKKLH